jgi:flagellar protein FliO/FliZ
MELWDSLLRTLSALAIVLVLMAVVAMAARRLLGQQPGQAGRHTLVRVVASGYVAPRKTISVVSVAGDYLIVGTTPTDLIPLGRVSDSEKVQELLAASAPGSSPSGQAMAPSVLASWLQCLPDGVRHRDQERHGER